jgi:hypothetical protein
MREILKDKPVESFPSVELADQISKGSPESEKKPLYIENLPGNKP